MEKLEELVEKLEKHVEKLEERVEKLEERMEKLEERVEKPTAFVDDGEHVRRGDVDVDAVHWGFRDRRSTYDLATIK